MSNVKKKIYLYIFAMMIKKYENQILKFVIILKQSFWYLFFIKKCDTKRATLLIGYAFSDKVRWKLLVSYKILSVKKYSVDSLAFGNSLIGKGMSQISDVSSNTISLDLNLYYKSE